MKTNLVVFGGVGFASCLAVSIILGCGSSSKRGDSGPVQPDWTSHQGIGKRCNASALSDLNQSLAKLGAPECPSGICLSPATDEYARTGIMPLGSLCSAGCSQDSDCVGELGDISNPNDLRCTSGFTCGIPFVTGPLACVRLCTCKDFLGPTRATTPAACAGPSSPAPLPQSGAAGLEAVTNVYLDVSPSRQVDLVFMIDNSAGMSPKQTKLKEHFGTLLTALKDPLTGDLPDLHVAIIDSDLGTGGAYPKDSTCGPNVANWFSPYGDLGHFQMPKATECGVTDANAKFLVYSKGKPMNFTGDINEVFKCLVSGIGTAGCGQEHQLQAFEWALINLGEAIGSRGQIEAFLRPEAYLGLVFLTDEDDCSAALNGGMFGTAPGKVDLSGESASLRCATRAHQCGGKNLTDSPPGYPTTAGFSADFTTCAARTDSCDNPTNINDPATAKQTDTSNPNLSCSPLKDVKLLADEIKATKYNKKLLVAGIFGWPRKGQDPLPYKIALVPNPSYQPNTTAKKEIYDYWPVCYDPSHTPASEATYDRDFIGSGATGGLRLSAFVDQFGDNGLKYSICESDYAEAMSGVGHAISNKLQYQCVDLEFLDADVDEPDVQPDCAVIRYQYPVRDVSNRLVEWREESKSLPQCPLGATPENSNEDCLQFLSDKSKCPKGGHYVKLVQTSDNLKNNALPTGTRVQIQCRTCPVLSPNSASSAGCN